MCSGKILITPLGYTQLQYKKAQLEDALLKARNTLADMAQGGVGDGFQDSFLLETQMNIQRMGYDVQEIKRLLSEVTIIEAPQQTNNVSIGHRVILTLIYPSGEHEALLVVLTASPELSLVEEHLINGELPVSPSSSLGKAIYGQTPGSRFSYEIESGVVHGEILKIELWQPAFEVPKLASL
ncbi:MAG: hypothetical protein KDE28_01645 [Anaerolineales bacterium]|nr:hypothetical protein [Anaerolineales bacterium]